MSQPRLVTRPFLLVTVATFAYFTSVGALVPIVPLFVSGPLGGGRVAVGVAVGIMALSAVGLRPFVGRLGDRRGRRPLVVAGSTIMGISILGYVVVGDLGPLIAFRLLGGVGEAFFYVGAATAINDMAPDERRGEALSIFSLALYGGLVAGPVLGETVLGASGFDWVWVASAAASGTAAVLAVWIPDTRPPAGEAPSSVGTASVLRRFVHPAGLGPGLVLATSIWGLASFNTFIPLHAPEVGLGGSRFVFVTFSAIVFAVRALGRRIPDRLGPRRAGAAALTANAAGLATLAAFPTPAGIFAGTVVFALGQSLAFPAMMTIAVAGAPASERGAVIGTFTAFFDLAFGVGAVSLGAVAAAVGLRGNFLTASGVALVGLVLLWRLGRRWAVDPAAARRGPIPVERPAP